RICPTPDGRCFEFLYMWHANDEECEFHGQSGIKDRLQDLEPFFAAGVGAHFKATMEVIERSRLRAQQTVKALTCE
ncbi:hypothetical protein KAR02_00340, partial [Candidatus Bipolaricaulota bacterium]|nr:hypothetical protein [Candidatus Bipolaricaulota bacterium]